MLPAFTDCDLSALPWATRFRSDDLDEVRTFVGDNDGRNSRAAPRGVPMGFSIYQLPGRRTNFLGTESAVVQTVRGFIRGPVLHLSIPVGSVYRTGRRASAPTGPSTVVLAPPGWEYTRASPPGKLLLVGSTGHALQDEVEALRTARGARWMGGLSVFDLAVGEKASLESAVSDLMHATQSGVDARQLDLAECRVVALLAGLALHRFEPERPGDLSLNRTRDLEGWIEAHLGEPITLGRLCQVAGVGARCLQKAFEYRRGMSPMRFVAERRLAAVHHRLMHAPERGTVSRIALELGFDHLGRFAQAYKEFIGESPHETLATARAAASRPNALEP
jgi:AraC-like DNA-binding protein